MTGPRPGAGRAGRPTWRSAAGILAAAFALALAAVLWQLVPILKARGQRAIGDTRRVESYGFDLSTCLVPREDIVAGGMPRDGVPVLESPRLLTAAGADSLRRAARYRYLVPSDRVIGLEVGGVARAYPLRVLCWHELALDTLGGRPVAVAYNALSDAAAAFADSLRFGVSGLLLDSHLLLYDRAPAPSLWSPLQGRAVAGPAAAAGRVLSLLPLAVVRWDDWRARHPATTVLFPEPAFRDRYRRDPYSTYFGDDRLRFPVRPLPPAGGLARKDPVVVVDAGGETVVYPLRAIAARVAGAAGANDQAPALPALPVLGPIGAAGRWSATQGSARLRFEYRPDPPTVFVDADEAAGDAPSAATAAGGGNGAERGTGGAGGGAEASAAIASVRSCFWFAWYAQESDARVLWP